MAFAIASVGAVARTPDPAGEVRRAVLGRAVAAGGMQATGAGTTETDTGAAAAVVLEGVEPFILDLPARPRGAHQLDDVGGGGHQVGDPGVLIGNLAVLDDPELDEVDERRVGIAVQRQIGDPLVLTAFAAVVGSVTVQQVGAAYGST